MDGRCYANVADRKAIVVHNVLCEIVGVFWVAGDTDTVADVRPPCDEHVGKGYALVADGKSLIIKGTNYFNFSFEVFNRTSCKM